VAEVKHRSLANITGCLAEACHLQENCYRSTPPLSEHRNWDKFYRGLNDCPMFIDKGKVVNNGNSSSGHALRAT